MPKIIEYKILKYFVWGGKPAEHVPHIKPVGRKGHIQAAARVMEQNENIAFISIETGDGLPVATIKRESK